MQEYNYSRLNGRIRERGFTQESLAKEVGISATSMNLSLNNKRNFKQCEILRMCEVLEIAACEIAEYFFAH